MSKTNAIINSGYGRGTWVYGETVITWDCIIVRKHYLIKNCLCKLNLVIIVHQDWKLKRSSNLLIGANPLFLVRIQVDPQKIHNNDMEIGDIVVLKSGGPLMTINKKYLLEVECIWFDNDGKLIVYKFRKDALKKIENL